MFWRRAFWTRPAFLIVASIGLLVSLPFVARAGYGELESQRLVGRGSLCVGSARSDCLVLVVGQLRGPFWTRRDPGHGWSVWVSDMEYDEFDLDERWDDVVEPLCG